MNRLFRSAGMLVLAAGLLPVGARAWARRRTGPATAPAAAAQAEVQNDVLSGFKREEMEDRRQEIVVANMKFTNDEQKTKFLAIYVPYQERLMNNLKQRKKLLDDYQNCAAKRRDRRRRSDQATQCEPDARQQPRDRGIKLPACVEGRDADGTGSESLPNR